MEGVGVVMTSPSKDSERKKLSRKKGGGFQGELQDVICQFNGAHQSHQGLGMKSNREEDLTSQVKGSRAFGADPGMETCSRRCRITGGLSRIDGHVEACRGRRLAKGCGPIAREGQSNASPKGLA